MKNLYILAAFLLSAIVVQAQHNHKHSLNEVGISSGAIYALDDKAWGTGTHLHYFRVLGDHSRWAIGAFAEQAWIKGNHFSVGAGLRYEPIEKLHLGLFPGVIFAKHNDDNHDGHGHEHGKDTRFSVHTEVVYDLFHVNNFHFGPVLDYSWSKNDSHTMLGIHAAYCF